MSGDSSCGPITEMMVLVSVKFIYGGCVRRSSIPVMNDILQVVEEIQIGLATVWAL